MNNIFGIVPSRRLGRSLGISPIPISTCTYSCVYCQLGRTKNMTMQRKEYFKIDDLLEQLMVYQDKSDQFDVITLVGEGEPTLYHPLGQLIERIKKNFDKPVALITNGSLLYLEQVHNDCLAADIVMPTLDAWDEESFTTLNRPIKQITFEKMFNGMKKFRENYLGEFYLEVMCVKGITDQGNNMSLLTKKINELNPDKCFINTPVRPPAEPWVQRCPSDFVENLRSLFKSNENIEIPDTDLFSHTNDTYQAILDIITRHPLDQTSIIRFCQTRDENTKNILNQLAEDQAVEKINYEDKLFFRIKSKRGV